MQAQLTHVAIGKVLADSSSDEEVAAYCELSWSQDRVGMFKYAAQSTQEELASISIDLVDGDHVTATVHILPGFAAGFLFRAARTVCLLKEDLTNASSQVV